MSELLGSVGGRHLGFPGLKAARISITETAPKTVTTETAPKKRGVLSHGFSRWGTQKWGCCSLYKGISGFKKHCVILEHHRSVKFQGAVPSVILDGKIRVLLGMALWNFVTPHCFAMVSLVKVYWLEPIPRKRLYPWKRREITSLAHEIVSY